MDWWVWVLIAAVVLVVVVLPVAVTAPDIRRYLRLRRM